MGSIQTHVFINKLNTNYGTESALTKSADIKLLAWLGQEILLRGIYTDWRKGLMEGL